jgi:adenine-specific DNA-methyltransferase
MADDQNRIDEFLLAAQENPPLAAVPKKTVRKKATTQPAVRANPNEETQVISYRHDDRRKNNPEVGMVNESTDPYQPKPSGSMTRTSTRHCNSTAQRSQVESLIDNALASGDDAVMRAALEELKRLQSPYLNWAGKAERTSFEVDTVSLHVHERIDPASILAAVRKVMKSGEGQGGADGADGACSMPRLKTCRCETRLISTSTTRVGVTAWWRVIRCW